MKRDVLQDAIPFTISPGLQREIDHLKSEKGVLYHRVEQLQERTENTLYATTVSELHAHLDEESEVIDIGCGFGETSLLLGVFGHRVHSVEPNKNRCQSLQQSFLNLGIKGHTYVCTGEDIDQLGIPHIDGALFFSSLHHCDDPRRALMNVKKMMNKKGVLLINEPILKFYRTKKWYYKQLIENPAKMGHYGGNEHIYYFKEYYQMLLDAGFPHIDFFWAHKNVDPRKTLIQDLSSSVQRKYQYSILRSVIKFLIHSMIKKMCATPFLNTCIVKPLIRMSLLQASFLAFTCK